jgi:excisionase family DNA binding protein
MADKNKKPDANYSAESLDRLCDKDEACKIIGVKTTKLYQLLKTGEITACKVGKSTRFRRSVLQNYIESLPAYQAEHAV